MERINGQCAAGNGRQGQSARIGEAELAWTFQQAGKVMTVIDGDNLSKMGEDMRQRFSGNDCAGRSSGRSRERLRERFHVIRRYAGQFPQAAQQSFGRAAAEQHTP